MSERILSVGSGGRSTASGFGPLLQRLSSTNGLLRSLISLVLAGRPSQLTRHIWQASPCSSGCFQRSGRRSADGEDRIGVTTTRLHTTPSEERACHSPGSLSIQRQTKGAIVTHFGACRLLECDGHQRACEPTRFLNDASTSSTIPVIQYNSNAFGHCRTTRRIDHDA